METKAGNSIEVSNKLENVLIMGDLSKLSPEERVMYYKSVCRSLNINPLTRPFDYITLNGKLTLYAKKDATDQLRARDGISIISLDSKTVNDIYLVTARATTKDGRSDAATGAVNIGGLKSDALANALMKAETKAKRRVTLSICGLGLLDETEIETIRDAQPTIVTDSGVIEELPEPIESKPVEYDDTPVPLDDSAPKMSLELAESELSSKKQRYGDIDSKILTYMYNAIAKHEKSEDNVRKMDAIVTILAARAAEE